MYVCLPYLKLSDPLPETPLIFFFGLRKFILVTHFCLKAYILCYKLTCDNKGTLDLSVNTVGCRGNKSGYWVYLKEVVGNTRGDRVLQLFIGTCSKKQKQMTILAQLIRISEILAYPQAVTCGIFTGCIVTYTHRHLRNEFNFYKVHRIMNTSGLLRSKWLHI